MPKRNNTAKRAARKQRRSKGVSGITGLTVSPGVVPPMFYTKFTYADYPIIPNLLGGVASYVYRANSIYDPNFTGVGATAYGVTQMSQLYDRYRVLSCKVKVDFTCTVGAVGGEVYIVVSNNNTHGTAVGNYQGQRFVWRRPIGPPSGNNIQRAEISFPIHKIYGVPKQQVRNEDDFASVMGNNPNNVVFIHLGFFATGAASTSTVTAALSMELSTVLSLPVMLTP